MFPDGELLDSLQDAPPGDLPYSGSQLELRARSEVRYTGTLHAVDPFDASVLLRDVACAGTEGRPPKPRAFSTARK